MFLVLVCLDLLHISRVFLLRVVLDMASIFNPREFRPFFSSLLHILTNLHVLCRCLIIIRRAGIILSRMIFACVLDHCSFSRFIVCILRVILSRSSIW